MLTQLPDPAFDARWTAWIARGRVQDARGQRLFLILAPLVTIGAFVAFTLLK